jgi:hypothetical protein
MSEYEEDKFMEQIQKWDAKHARHNFLEKMNRKLDRKEHSDR